jgi:predicted alpha/beta-hydrolase family hydrolase
MEFESFSDNSVDGHVRGFLHRPEKAVRDALVLTHGAGGNSRGALLIALAEAFSNSGFAVLRCDLPFRQARSFGPPRPAEAARDRAGLKNAVAAMRKLAPGRAFLGGQSYGGRQASMLVAEELGVADGLLLLSYPLHAPGKPDQLRTQHLPGIKIPALFVHGTRDPFGSIEEIEHAIKLIPGKTKLMAIEGVGHDLGFKGKARPSDLPGMVLAEFEKLVG